ncbi:hypothetical protein V6R21_08350 [Limibacter armeniacum]|uniref:hypothetical protein n=1 Tax=Limibacter armeniacum TaxID=466084 RepID=UPI002FE67A9E
MIKKLLLAALFAASTLIATSCKYEESEDVAEMRAAMVEKVLADAALTEANAAVAAAQAAQAAALAKAQELANAIKEGAQAEEIAKLQAEAAKAAAEAAAALQEALNDLEAAKIEADEIIAKAKAEAEKAKNDQLIAAYENYEMALDELAGITRRILKEAEISIKLGAAEIELDDEISKIDDVITTLNDVDAPMLVKMLEDAESRLEELVNSDFADQLTELAALREQARDLEVEMDKEEANKLSLVDDVKTTVSSYNDALTAYYEAKGEILVEDLSDYTYKMVEVDDEDGFSIESDWSKSSSDFEGSSAETLAKYVYYDDVIEAFNNIFNNGLTGGYGDYGYWGSEGFYYDAETLPGKVYGYLDLDNSGYIDGFESDMGLYELKSILENDFGGAFSESFSDSDPDDADDGLDIANLTELQDFRDNISSMITAIKAEIGSSTVDPTDKDYILVIDNGTDITFRSIDYTDAVPAYANANVSDIPQDILLDKLEQLSEAKVEYDGLTGFIETVSTQYESAISTAETEYDDTWEYNANFTTIKSEYDAAVDALKALEDIVKEGETGYEDAEDAYFDFEDNIIAPLQNELNLVSQKIVALEEIEETLMNLEDGVDALADNNDSWITNVQLVDNYIATRELEDDDYDIEISMLSLMTENVDFKWFALDGDDEIDMDLVGIKGIKLLQMQNAHQVEQLGKVKQKAEKLHESIASELETEISLSDMVKAELEERKVLKQSEAETYKQTILELSGGNQ